MKHALRAVGGPVFDLNHDSEPTPATSSSWLPADGTSSSSQATAGDRTAADGAMRDSAARRLLVTECGHDVCADQVTPSVRKRPAPRHDPIGVKRRCTPRRRPPLGSRRTVAAPARRYLCRSAIGLAGAPAPLSAMREPGPDMAACHARSLRAPTPSWHPDSLAAHCEHVVATDKMTAADRKQD
jgi:hypothetical protein